jgi:putative transposase
MSRPLRIEFPGAVYHVTSRGDRREAIYLGDADRRNWLDVLALGLARFDAQALAYCLMGNHYHVVLHTRQANLSLLMRHLNGVYTQDFNRRHRKVGHLFQGRFKAILVDRDAYMLEVCRYVELNPVRAGIVSEASEWAWSSYRTHAGLADAPDWLDTAGLHGYLLGRVALTSADSRRAAARYAALVVAGRDVRLAPADLSRRCGLCRTHAAVAGTSRFAAAKCALARGAAPATPRTLHAGPMPGARPDARARAAPGPHPQRHHDDGDCPRTGFVGVTGQPLDCG